MPKQTALDTINRLIAEENSSGATRQRTGDAVRTIDRLIAEEEENTRKREEEERRRAQEQQQTLRNAASAGEAMDMVRSYGDYALERRAAEMPQPVKEERQTLGPNALTPEMEAQRQAAAGVNRAPTAYQTYMMQAVNAQPRQEETRSTDELRRDMNRQNRIARGTERMAADMGSQMLQDQSLIYNPTYAPNLRTLGQTMETQQAKADRATELYQTLSVQRREQEEREKYAALMSNPDFVSKSQGDPTIGNKTSSTSLAPAERLYQKIFHRNDTKDANGNIKDAAGSDAARFVNDEEAAIFYYLWNTQGAKAAQAYYYGYVENRAGERRAQLAQQQAQAYGEYDPVGASIARVGYNAMSGIGLVDMALQNLTRVLGITDRNKPLNYNSDAQLPGQVADALQSGASSFVEQFAADEIKRINPNVKHPENYAKVASFLYQTGMSMADSSVAIALNLMGIPEPLTLANMGAAAGTRAIREARERGATDGQALAFGFSSAIMEALFEKISLDRILEPSYAQTTKAHLLNALKQSFTEGSEEVMTTLSNTAADMLIMGDKSELFARQRQLMEQGVGEKEALGAAFKQWGTGIVGDLLGGMISGFGMGGAKEVGAGLGVFAQGVRQDVQTARALTDYQNAQQAAPQITPQQVAPAEPAVQQRQLTAREQNPLWFAMNKTQTGETVTGNDAKAILNDPQAMQTLRVAGVLADTIRPGAEGRAQIQQAVQALAEQYAEGRSALGISDSFADPPPVAQERTTPPLPRQAAQEQQERVTTPPVPQNTQEAAQEPALRIRENEVAEPTRQAPLTIRGANATVEENRQEESYGQGQQTETAAAAGEDGFRSRAETAAEGARRTYLDRIERSSGLGRVLQDLRNYRVVRGAESRASDVSRIRNQAEAGNQRDVSAQDYGIANGSAEQSAKELDNATASRVLGRNWDRAVSELARQGVTLKAMTGQLKKEDGTQVRAFFSGDGKTIVVQADHPKLSWNQLLDHEDLHRRIKADRNYRKAVEDALLADRNLQAYLPEIIDRYAQAYARLAPGLSSDDVIEELLADYRAGFDMLDPLGTNPITARAAKRAAKDIKSVEKGRYGSTGRARQEDVAKVGISLDSKTESANPGNFSIETWNASDYVQNSAAAAADLAEQLGVSNRQAKKYINDINSIAKIIANDRVRLDYTPSPNRSSFIGNTEYGGSIDFSTICKKRRLYTGTIEAIQKALPNTAITADELLNIRAMMKDRGYEVSCGLCYVEGSRVKIGEYTQQFLNELKGTGMYVPTMAEMNTSDGQEQIRAEHPEVYEQYVKFMNKLAQRKPKLFQMATEYQGEILKKFKNDGTVDQKNRNGGLRLQSFSDFEIIHLIDTMQVIMDMSRVGLAGQAYTKVPDFAWALGDTGMKINLSLIAKGVDENGHIILDEVEGMKRADAEALRNAYSKNVGTILVTFNDEQLKAAMADPFIDFIIPFHRSQWSKAQYDAIGLPKGTKDYTDQQNESYTEKVYNANGKPQRPANYMPNNYWDFNKSGKENAEAYLRMCAENNRTPKFYKLLVDNGDGSFSLQKDGSTDGYWKLLSDFKMYDNAGKGSPQLPVKPKFNMEQAERMLNEYTGGHQKFPVAQDVVDDFLKGKQEGKASTEIDTDYLAAVNSGDMETAQQMVDEAAKRAGYTTPKLYHGTRAFGFTRFDTSKSGDGISIFATNNPQTAQTYSGETQRNRVNDIPHIDVNSLSGEQLLEEAKKQPRLKRYQDYRVMSDDTRQKLFNEDRKGLAVSENDAKDFLNKHREEFGKEGAAAVGRFIDALSELRKAKTDDQLDDAFWKLNVEMWDIRWTSEDNGSEIAYEFMDEIGWRQIQAMKNRLSDFMYTGDIFIDKDEYGYVFDNQIALELDAELHKGVYELYGKPGRQLVINANGANWNQITPPEELNLYGPQKTRDIATAAKANGYDSVLFKWLRDNGGETAYNRESDVYIFFNAEQLKSADPVTYDNDGNIIPLSERFNPADMDIRYSIEIDPEVAAQFSPEAIARRQSNRTKGVKGERKVSRVRSNTYEYSGLYNEVEAQMDEADEENFTYDPVSEKKSMNEALGRLKADFDGEVSRLSEADRQWGGSDLDTAMGILHRYRTEGRATGDYGDFWRWSKVIQERGTEGGKFIQAFAKYTRTGTGAAMKGAKDIHDRFKLNPAQQKQVDAVKKKLMDGIDGDMNGAAQDAMKQAKGKKEPTKKQDGKVDKKKLDAEIQRRKDAERLVREISKLFEKQQNHGEPVENWLNLTGEELARKIAGRFSEPKQRTKTTMQTILSDLVGFAEEHALPDRRKAEGTKRTAIDTITDYLNNRDAYGTAWAAAQSYLRAAYTDDQEKLDALNSFLTATIAYNAEGTDRTMLDAILQSADVLGISEKRILELTSAGATASTIDRIGDELVSQVKERMGADYDESFTQQLKDAVRRHITGIALQESAEEQRLRLGGMTTDAARQLELNLQKLLTQSRGDKNKAAQSVADYLIRELGIPSSDAAIAAERITGAFMDELASRADRKLQQMFAEKKPKTQEQRDRLLDLIRLGGLTNSNVEDAVVDALGIGGMSRERQRELVGVMAQFGETLDAMEADDLDGLKDLIRAQAAVRNTPLSRQAEKALTGETDAQYLREFALAQLDAIAGDFAEMSPGAKISTFQTISHLLNMRTALRNLTSNQVFDLVDSAANNLATIPDMVIGAFTGKRTVGVNKSWLSEMKRAGAKQGAARNALEVRLDVSPDDRQKSKYGTAGRRTNSMAASNAFGRILSHLEEVMGYELNTTDEFHKGSVRGETLESLARFVERGDITQEQANAWAEEEALYRSFQDDTLVGNIMGELKTLLNVIGFGDSGKTNSRGRTIHDFGLGDLVVKYTQVPGALIHRGIEYSPLGYAKMLYDLAIAKDSLVRTQKRGEDVTNAQRKLALDIGRATTGSGLITLFAVLAKAGLLRRDDDDKDKNAKAMHATQGLSGTQLNLTALKRWIEGGDLSLTDGDVLADIGFLEPLDSLMTIATLMANDDDLKLTDIGVKSLDGVWKAISNTSAMQTISNIIQTVQYHDDENDLPLYFQIPIEIASDSISGFVPSPVRQLAQATDTTYRDQYRSKALNDQVKAKVMNSIPGLRQTLAPKITPLGEDRKYQKPLLNYLNATLNPGNINVYQGSRVVDELNRVYAETDDAKIWPERNAPYSFTANDEKWTLTPDERTQYQRTRGQTTANAMDAAMGTDWYKSMGATDQAEVLNWIGNFSNFVAKKEMLESRGQEYGSTTYNKYYEAWQSGTPIEEVVADKYGKLVTAAAETAKAETIIAEANIPDASKEEAETMSADAKRLYAAFLQGGVSDSTARNLATSMEGSEASGHEQWRMVYDAAGKEGEKAVTSVMTDDMKRNWNLAKDAGVSMDDYIKVREGFKDLNGNGNKSQDEWNATLDSFTFSTNAAKDKSIKGTLWQILTGSGSTKNNPYDKEAGQKVIDSKSGGGSGSGSYAPARIPTLRIPAVPTVSKPSSGLRIRAQ